MTAIVLTGASGAVGGVAAGLLADAGVPVRLLVRDRSRAPQLPGAESGFLLGHDHAATEDHLRASGLEWTFLGDNFYAEILPAFATGGVIRGPAGSGRVAAVSQRDVGAVLAHVLQQPREHAGRSYDLTGPAALTFTKVVEELSEITGRPHTFVDETMDEAKASRSGHGAPDWLVDAWISTYTAIRDGELEHVSNDITRLLGRPATSFGDAVAEAQA